MVLALVGSGLKTLMHAWLPSTDPWMSCHDLPSNHIGQVVHAFVATPAFDSVENKQKLVEPTLASSVRGLNPDFLPQHHGLKIARTPPPFR